MDLRLNEVIMNSFIIIDSIIKYCNKCVDYCSLTNGMLLLDNLMVNGILL